MRVIKDLIFINNWDNNFIIRKFVFAFALHGHKDARNKVKEKNYLFYLNIKKWQKIWRRRIYLPIFIYEFVSFLSLVFL